MAQRATLRLLLLAVLAAGMSAACGGDPEPAPVQRPLGVSTRTPDPLATPRPAPTLPPLDPALERWAEALCAITVRFDDAVASVQDEVDPRELPIEDRIDRGRRRFRAYIDSLQAERDELGGMEPAPGTETYQRAVGAQIGELERIFEEAIDRIEGAASGAEIDAAVADLEVEVERLGNSVRLAARTLPDDAVRALTAVRRCGQLLG